MKRKRLTTTYCELDEIPSVIKELKERYGENTQIEMSEETLTGGFIISILKTC